MGADPIRVLIADDEPALRIALADLLAHDDEVVLIGSAGDADEAIQLAVDEHPDVALVDVKMPAGGGPRAAREIMRVSPDTRVIALSAFEDRPTVLEMLRAGAVGYLVKGTAGEEILGSIQKVMAGGASLSSEVIAGIVHELTQQLRREEAAREERDARRGEIERFVAGEGLSMVFQPIVELSTPEHRRGRGAGPVPFAPVATTERMVRRGGPAGAGRAAGAHHDRPGPARAGPGARGRLPGGELLASRGHLLPTGAPAGIGRRPDRAGDHRTRGGRGLRRPGDGARPPARDGRPHRDRRCRRGVRQHAPHPADHPRHREDGHEPHPGDRRRPREAGPRGGPDLVHRGDGHRHGGRGHRNGGGTRHARDVGRSLRSGLLPGRTRPLA